MSGAGEALVYESLPPGAAAEAMPRAMGRIGFTAKLSSVAAFALSSFLSTNLSFGPFLATVAFTAVLIFAAFLVALGLVDPHVQARRDARPRGSAVLSAVKAVWARPRLRRLTLLFVLSNPLSWFLLNIYSPYMRQAGLAAWAFGIVVALASMTAALTERFAYLVPRWLDPDSALLVATLLPGLVYLAMALLSQAMLSPVLYALQTAAQGLRGPIFSGQFNAEIREGERAAVLSAINTLSNAASAGLGLVISAVNDQSLSAGFALLGTIVILAALLNSPMSGSRPLPGR
jgi:MFS family permease